MTRVRVMLGWLVLGAIVNVMVAFGAAAFLKPDYESEITPTEIRALMAEQSLVDWYRHNVIVGVEVTSFALRHIELADMSRPRGLRFPTTPPTTVPSPPAFLTYAQSGWPLVCFRGWYYEQGLIVITDKAVAFGSRAIPYDTNVGALTINSLVYAVLLAGTVTSLRIFRRMLRLHRGLCMHCAYDLRGTPADHEVCPECGAAITRVKPA